MVWGGINAYVTVKVTLMLKGTYMFGSTYAAPLFRELSRLFHQDNEATLRSSYSSRAAESRSGHQTGLSAGPAPLWNDVAIKKQQIFKKLQSEMNQIQDTTSRLKLELCHRSSQTLTEHWCLSAHDLFTLNSEWATPI